MRPSLALRPFVRAVRAALAVLAVLAVLACGSGGGAPGDAGADATQEASGRETGGGQDAHRDAVHDANQDGVADALGDAGKDAAPPAAPLVRLASFSPDAPALDFCVSPHGLSLWSTPVLAGALGTMPLGTLTVVDAAIAVDAGHHGDAGHVDAGIADGGVADATKGDADDQDAARDASPLDAENDGPVHAVGGVSFPRVSPYVTLLPGLYDLRVVVAGSTDCSSPVLPDVLDAPRFVAGTVATLALVGDANDQGADPGLALSILDDDTTVAPSEIALRFVNAIPSVESVTLASGTVAKGTNEAYLGVTQFGAAGADTDAGVLDSNDYLFLPPITDKIWSLINANGGTTTLVAVEGVTIPAGKLATVVGVGGESGPDELDVGILVCLDTPPIVVGETAACQVYEESSQPVAP